MIKSTSLVFLALLLAVASARPVDISTVAESLTTDAPKDILEFEVLSKEEDFEVRKYNATTWAIASVNFSTTDIPDPVASLKKLEDYFHGANGDKVEIPQTHPIVTAYTKAGKPDDDKHHHHKCHDKKGKKGTPMLLDTLATVMNPFGHSSKTPNGLINVVSGLTNFLFPKMEHRKLDWGSEVKPKAAGFKSRGLKEHDDEDDVEDDHHHKHHDHDDDHHHHDDHHHDDHHHDDHHHHHHHHHDDFNPKDMMKMFKDMPEKHHGGKHHDHKGLDKEFSLSGLKAFLPELASFGLSKANIKHDEFEHHHEMFGEKPMKFDKHDHHHDDEEDEDDDHHHHPHPPHPRPFYHQNAVQMHIPSNMENAPAPVDDFVKIVKEDNSVIRYVREFSGYAIAPLKRKEFHILAHSLKKAGVNTTEGSFYLAVYDPILKVFNRRNEVWWVKNDGGLAERSEEVAKDEEEDVFESDAGSLIDSKVLVEEPRELGNSDDDEFEMVMTDSLPLLDLENMEANVEEGIEEPVESTEISEETDSEDELAANLATIESAVEELISIGEDKEVDNAEVDEQTPVFTAEDIAAELKNIISNSEVAKSKPEIVTT